ncbi:MAG: FAD-dependent monooxygenase, partial [Verrucomicrobiota bacterium]
MGSMPIARIAIIGCGMTGPSAALLLHRAGHAVEVFEQAPVCSPVGAGFLLQPTGLAVLEHLGLMAAVLPRGAKVRRLFCRTHGGRPLLRLAYGEVETGSFGLGLSRPVLLEAFLSAMRAEGLPVNWDHECTGLKALPGGVDLIFEIEEGPPTKVSGITFIGNEAFSDSTLRGVIETKEEAWYRFFSTVDTYDPDRLAFDQELLRR